MKSAKSLDRYYTDAIRLNVLKITEDGNYIIVEGKNTLTAQGDEYRWSLVCTVEKQSTVIDAVNRINLLLAEGLRSSKQDVNILMSERVK